jgi:hypothetical protein
MGKDNLSILELIKQNEELTLQNALMRSLIKLAREFNDIMRDNARVTNEISGNLKAITDNLPKPPV